MKKAEEYLLPLIIKRKINEEDQKYIIKIFKPLKIMCFQNRDKIFSIKNIL